MKIPKILFVIPMACGLALGAMTTEAIAQNECAAACRAEAKDCLFDTRQTHELCVEEDCSDLRDAYRSACLVDEPNDAVCDPARDAFQGCLEACHEDARALGKACKADGRQCLSEECGIDTDRRRHRDRNRDGRRPRRGGPQGSSF